MKARYLSLGTLAIIAMACIQDPEAPSNLPDAPKLTVDETSVTRVSMVVNGSFGKNMTDVTAYGVEVSETLFEDGGTYTTLVPQDVSASGFSVGVSNLKSNGTYFLRAFISNGHSKMYSSTITQKTPETSVASISDVTLKDNYYLVATIEDNGGRSIEDVGFMWGTSNERKSIKREKRYPGTLSEDGKTFTLPLDQVGEGTHYIMAYAEDDKDGTGYSRIPYEFVLKGEDEAQIEDPEFKKYLVMYHDLNQDGKISYAEIKQIETIDVHTDNIRSVREIEQMPLRSLMVSGMQERSGKLTSLIVKKDTLMRFMDCSNNQLKELDASMIPELEYLNCEGNPMETLYLSYYQKFNELRYPQGCRIVYVDAPEGQPNTEIWYTTTDGKVVDPDIYNIGFGAQIVSNKYEDGKGVITFDQPVTRIGYYAFAGKSTLATISIPGSVTVIDEGAFTNCSGLAWPEIPESVTRIGDSAFFGCEAFTRVAIPETVTEFGYSIFQTCPNLASISSRFASADNRCLIVNGVLNAFAYAGLGEEYVFPQSVVSVGNSALRNSAYNGALSFAGSLTSVEKEAFAYAYYIKSIDFGSNLESVGEGSFVMCGADTLTLPASLTSVGADAFAAGFDKLTFLSTTPPTASGLMFETQYLKDFNFPVYVPAESVQAYKTAEYWSNYADRIQSMDGGQPNNEIWYTSRDGNVVTPYKTDGFGANIVSNTYSNGKGIIVFDGDVTAVGGFAFDDCKQLTAMWLPSTVTSIGTAAFQSCNSLEKLDVQEGLTFIGEFAFGNCYKLWDIELPQSLETIEDSAFSHTAIVSVTIPEGLISLGRSVFTDCQSLERFSGKYASSDGRCLIFDDGTLCEFAPAGLTEYNVPDGVTRIGYSAFYYCSKLTSLTIPEGVVEIGEMAFCFCSSLTTFHIPSTVTTVNRGAFHHCDALESFTGKFVSDDNRCLIVEDSSLKAVIAFAPAGLTAYSVPDGVTIIGQAFFFCTRLEEIFLPESVTEIMEKAFYRCYGLEKIHGAGQLQSIGNETFRYCTALTSIDLPDAMRSIGRYAFADCTNLAQMQVLADTPPTLGENAFYQDDNLTIYVPSASLASYKNSWSAYADRIQPMEEENPNAVIYYTSTDGEVVNPYATDVFGATIVSNTYENGQGVIVFSSPVTAIGSRAFYRCSTLSSIVIPESVTGIGELAFSDCENLAWPSIPSSVVGISNSAFFGCDSFTQVTIPDTVTQYGYSIFQACMNLSSIIGQYASADGRCLVIDGVLNSFASAGLADTYTFPDIITSIGKSALRNCRFKGKLILGDNVTRIESEAFSYTSYTSIEFGKNLSFIGASAFRACGKCDMVLPASLKEIENDVFSSTLPSLTVMATVPPTATGTIVSDDSTVQPDPYPIYVPAESVEAYKSAQYWSDYADRIHPIGGETASGGNEGTSEEEWN